ncbi:hypothetical protein [Qipengyuania nanhaisediminis]|uniref:hypothetical protein n=1 Tax=Qipengyuania nanhaisediminis TaxID=604088 RepID=UPI0038B4162B
MLEPPRQTVTGAKVIGVFAAANENGSLLENLGLSHVRFHCEGDTVTVDAPAFRTFSRPDGSTYSIYGWWVTLTKPSNRTGIADIYVEAVPSDAIMQSRVIGPYPFVMAATAHDFEVTVAAGGGADHTTMASAFAFLRAQDAQHPRITVIEPGTYDLASGGSHHGGGYCTIEAAAPVTFRQDPPALPFDFTRMRPQYDRLHFKGSNITIDMVESLEFYTESTSRHHWLDGCNIVQSRGRDDLWRMRPRNIVPSLFRGGAYFTDCIISDVNDWGDKSALARGNRTSATWADALQDATCAIANTFVDHSSAPYYANIDAISLQYVGAASSATISLSGNNASNLRSLTLMEDGVAVASFVIESTEQAYRDATNYSVANVVDFINAQPDWTATLLDNSRFAAALSFPGTTNGAGFTDLDAKSSAITLPTHFDIHSDLYQLPNLGSVRENVVFAFNTGWQIDAQDMLVTGSGGINDAAFVGNAFFNKLGSLDEGLSSQLNNDHSHVIFAHNSLPTQKLLVRQDSDYDGDGYTLIANNVTRELNISGGSAVDPDVMLIGNHVTADGTAPDGGVDTSLGGDHLSLFFDATNGNFAPAGLLLSNLKTPVIAPALADTLREGAAPAGAAL